MLLLCVKFFSYQITEPKASMTSLSENVNRYSHEEGNNSTMNQNEKTGEYICLTVFIYEKL